MPQGRRTVTDVQIVIGDDFEYVFHIARKRMRKHRLTLD